MAIEPYLPVIGPALCERTQKRNDDTCHKIIAGALVLEHAERNPDSEFTRTMLRLMQSGTKTDKDRALFDLEPMISSTDEVLTKTLWKRITRG